MSRESQPRELVTSIDSLTFEVELGAGLERPVDELESLPHGRRDALCSECAAVDDLKDLVVQVCK